MDENPYQSPQSELLLASPLLSRKVKVYGFVLLGAAIFHFFMWRAFGPFVATTLGVICIAMAEKIVQRVFLASRRPASDY